MTLNKKAPLAATLAFASVFAATTLMSASALVIYNTDGSIAFTMNIDEKRNASVPSDSVPLQSSNNDPEVLDVQSGDPLPANLESDAAEELPYDEAADLSGDDLPYEGEEAEGLDDEAVEELPYEEEPVDDEVADEVPDEVPEEAEEADDAELLEEEEPADDASLPYEIDENDAVAPVKVKRNRRAPKTADPASEIMVLAGLGLGFCATLTAVTIRRRRAMRDMNEDK